MYGVLNQDTNKYKKGVKVHILNEYHDKTCVGNYVYVVRIVEDDPELYINTYESKFISDKVNFESFHGGIEVIATYKVDVIQ
ncbi:hypothetical protein [Brevibacillus sp. NRS-1366]|uniref:hypothetical protein n=1 Tax=Brevibacillus sp. NRS-1366 TaxID=3233899 RepID=UPI003D1FDFBB